MTATSALGLALVHFLWQGAALAIMLAVALTVLRARAARTRYALSLLTLIAMLLLPVATGLRLSTRAADLGPAAASIQPGSAPDQAASSKSPAPSATAAHSSPIVVTQQSTARLRDLLDPALPWLVVIWVIGVVVLSVRLAH